LNLNSVEGFIRQVCGWREYMHGLYHHVGEDYFRKNWFEHTQPLPWFFWDAAQAKMNCLHQTLEQVERMSYAHHIQRLMILSNFALIAGLSPQAVEDWFHSAFIDAYDWVMQTNVLGMGLFADGGMLASKPYAASANYVNKMSDYCKTCVYNPKKRVGDGACPFNFFYWDFLDRHRDKLKSQGRMSFILANLDKIPADELAEIRQQAKTWREEQQ
jgi:deoxyribodipyrimidine photolyase-related protein